METLFLAVSEFSMGAQHDLQMARQVFLAEELGDAAHAGAFIGRNLQRPEALPAIFATVTFRRKRTNWRAKCVGLWPSPINSSTSTRILSLELSATACITVSSAVAGAAPIRLRTERRGRWSEVEARAGAGIERG